MKWSQARTLVQAGVVEGARIYPYPLRKGWAVELLVREGVTGFDSPDLCAQHSGKVRRFAELHTAVGALKDLGLGKAEIEFETLQ